MKTTTTEAESPLALDASEPLEVVPPSNDLDPDFTIEAAGGPSDGGGGSQVGPTQPPG